MSTKHFTVLAVALLIVIIFAQAFSQEGRMVKRGREKMILEDMTEEQKEQIRALRTEVEKELLPMRSKLRIKSAELDELLVVDKPDMKTIHRKVDEISALRTEMQKKHVDNRLKIRGLMTDEQRVRFDTMRTRRGGRDFHQGRFSRKGRIGKRSHRSREFMGRGFR